jgi:hypothetical protein
MSDSALYYVQTAVCVAMLLFGLWKGGPPERMGVSVIFGIVILQRIVVALTAPSLFTTVQLVGDALTAMGLLAIAVAYGSLWIGAAMLLYAAQFTLHSFYFVTERATDRFHVIVNNLNFIGVILCLALGTGIAWRQRVVANRKAALAAAAPSA